jgi:pantoate kinase
MKPLGPPTTGSSAWSNPPLGAGAGAGSVTVGGAALVTALAEVAALADGTRAEAAAAARDGVNDGGGGGDAIADMNGGALLSISGCCSPR